MVSALQSSDQAVSEPLEIGQCVRIKHDPAETVYCLERWLPNGKYEIRNCLTRERCSIRITDLIYAPPPESNFKLRHDKWEHLVFVNAHHYRCTRKHDRSVSGQNYDTFPEAVEAAKEKIGDRAGLVYAVTASKRSRAFGEREWDQWLAVWYALPGVKGNGKHIRQTRQPEPKPAGQAPVARRARS